MFRSLFTSFELAVGAVGVFMASHIFTIILSFLCCIHYIRAAKKCELKSLTGNTTFPSHFKFGVGTSAYQIEGGWNEDGKGQSIWDTFTHEHPELISDKSTGDVTADSYHRFDQDLAALKELGVNFYRFSISWPRILPNGDISSLNSKGIEYYNMVINKLLENNIEPMVTMYHWDMPEELHKFGGLTNSIFIDYFKFYAETLFKNFGDRVKVWATFNEPYDYCVPGYGIGIFPPAVHAPGVADYLCLDTTLKAHAVVYRLYKRDFKEQGGKIGIVISSRFHYSLTNNTAIVDRAQQFNLGWLAYPIFGPTGNYNDVILNTITKNSKKEGRAWPRLQPIDENWRDMIKGAADFLGINYYTSRYVGRAHVPPGERPSYDYDAGLTYSTNPKWRRAKSSWLHCVPKGLEDLLKWIRDHYKNVEVMVTENGWSDDGQLDDTDRIDYLRSHLQAILNAVNDGCNVTRYTHWSLLDNFEWLRGYTQKFGLYFVNMTSSNKDRIPKDSARYFRKVIANKSIPDN